MIQNTITIHYNDGWGIMNIRLNEFFPTSQAKMKKLFSLIELDWENCDTIIQTIREWLDVALNNAQEECKIVIREYNRIHQLRVEAEERVMTRKWPNGLPMIPLEIKNETEKWKTYKSQEKYWCRRFNEWNKPNSRIVRLTRNIAWVDAYMNNRR